MRRGAPPLATKKIKAIYDLLDQGTSQKKISEIVKCSRTTVKRYAENPRPSFSELIPPPAIPEKRKLRGFYIPVPMFVPMNEILLMGNHLTAGRFSATPTEWIEGELCPST